MSATTYTRPRLYTKQEEALFCPERYSCIEASTKAGKTVGSMAWLLEQALLGQNGHNYWWVAPISSQAEIAFRRYKNGLSPGSFTPFESPNFRIKLLNGAMLWFKSADNPDSLYGEDVYAAVIDEASRAKEDSYVAVRSTLTATNGPLRMIGNVKGRKNWFYNLCRKAEAEMLSEADPHKRRMRYAKITAKDAVEAGVITEEEVEDARAMLPEDVFNELYYAIPSDDSGNPFGLKHIANCTRDKLAPGPAVAFGIDLAKKQDFFVVIGLNEAGGVCVFERWNKVPWAESIRRVRLLVGEDAPAYVDSTGVGDPVLEELQREHGNFTGYMFSSTSKQKLMEGLAVSIQSSEISFPSGQIVLELENFEYVYTKSGKVAYAGIEGMNDDCVCALALARQAFVTVEPGKNMMEFYRMVADKQKALDEEVQSISVIDTRRGQSPLADEPIDMTTFENELAEIYEQAARQLSNDNNNLCRHCGLPVVGQRSTDGEFVWHIEHSGLLPKKRA